MYKKVIIRLFTRKCLSLKVLTTVRTIDMLTVYNFYGNLELIDVSSDFKSKGESDLLSRMSLEIEFQSFAPSYMKLLFILLVRGFVKQRHSIGNEQ